MNLKWNDERTRKFVTNIGLITSNGPYGNNIMSAEWTHHISYTPSLIMTNIHPFDATTENIIKSKEFGINIASENQNSVASVAGGSTGKMIDKIKVLEELGIEFYKAKKINVLMMKDASMNAECKLLKMEEMGDHIIFIGEVLEISSNDKMPLIYHDGKYWKIGERLHKPDQDILEKIDNLVEKHKKK